jgi:hypothetical protein
MCDCNPTVRQVTRPSQGIAEHADLTDCCVAYMACICMNAERAPCRASQELILSCE